MSDVDVTLKLPEDLVARARANGVLSNERVAQLLHKELERLENWHSLNNSLEPIREIFRADHPDMTEDEIIDLLNEVVHEVRSDKDTRQ